MTVIYRNNNISNLIKFRKKYFLAFYDIFGLHCAYVLGGIDNKLESIQFFSSKARRNSYVKNLYNAYLGLCSGYYFKFALRGLGFKVQVFKKNFIRYLGIDLGFSHFKLVKFPSELFVRKNKKYEFFICGFDKKSVKDLAIVLQALRFPDLYKGKGVHFQGERVPSKLKSKISKRR